MSNSGTHVTAVSSTLLIRAFVNKSLLSMYCTVSWNFW